MKSVKRAIKFDRVVPTVIDSQQGARQASPDEISKMKSFIQKNVEKGRTFDIIVEGQTPGDDPRKGAEVVKEWEDAGATWWTETFWGAMDHLDWFELTRKRIEQGPPGS